MAWRVDQDREHYDTAHRLQQEHARLWLIMWAPASRAYVAFYKGEAVVRPPYAPTAEGLRWAILNTEHRVARFKFSPLPIAFPQDTRSPRSKGSSALGGFP